MNKDDIVKIANEIYDLQKKLGEMKGVLRTRGEERATTEAAYDRELTITILRLQNGAIKEHEGQPIEKCPVTILKDVARGICHAEKLKKETADALYRSAISNISTTETQICALQSIYRHLERI